MKSGHNNKWSEGWGSKEDKNRSHWKPKRNQGTRARNP